jgi:hypothetical protein
MLRVTRRQKDAFSEAALQRFEERMLLHLRMFFAPSCDALGEAAVREIVRSGVARAARHGIVSERGVCLYVDTMILHGRYFDRDPERPWAARILEDRAVRDPGERARRLFDAAFEHAQVPQRAP